MLVVVVGQEQYKVLLQEQVELVAVVMEVRQVLHLATQVRVLQIRAVEAAACITLQQVLAALAS
jgi:hypothetical protein